MKAWNIIRQAVTRFVGSYSLFLSPRQAGVYIDEHRALQLAAVYGCTRIIAESIAGLPWRVYQRSTTGTFDKPVTQHLPSSPIDWLINIQPNVEMNSFQFREFMLASALLWGNGYAEIERDQGGRPIALWPITPDRVRVWRNPDSLAVEYIVSGGMDGLTAIVPMTDMLHLRGMGFDGLLGYSVIRLAARTMGIGIALEQFGASYFANGTHPSGLLTTPQKLQKQQVDELRAQWEEIHKGAENSRKAAILHGDMKWQPLVVPPQDSQFLEMRKFEVIDIARWFRVPPHKVGDLSGSRHVNIEQQSIEFVTDCLVPWISRLEQEANVKLIGRNSRATIYTRINVNALMRGDIKTRYDAYGQARRDGWLSGNDIRELEDLNPYVGGDLYLVQAQMVPLDMLRERTQATIDLQEAQADAAEASGSTGAPSGGAGGDEDPVPSSGAGGGPANSGGPAEERPGVARIVKFLKDRQRSAANA